jgi:hypothetical protein
MTRDDDRWNDEAEQAQFAREQQIWIAKEARRKKSQSSLLWGLGAALALILLAAASSCSRRADAWEAASTWDPKRGRYVSTEEYKKQHGVKQVCQSASCWDDKSGHFVSGEEWNRRQEDRARAADGDTPR